MNLQPTLENELVSLRPLEEKDLEPLFLVAKDSKIWVQHGSKRYLRSEFERSFHEALQSKGSLAILDKTTQKIIGNTRFKRIDGWQNSIEIGWTFIARSYWGGKYNKAVKYLMIQHAFNYMDNIIFFIAESNLRSQKAVEKIAGRRIAVSEQENFPQKTDYITYVIEKQQS